MVALSIAQPLGATRCRAGVHRTKATLVCLALLDSDEHVRFDVTDTPEFDCWKWVNYWHPLKEVVSFKRRVYECALHELQPLLCPGGDSGRVLPKQPSLGAGRVLPLYKP